MAGGVARFSPEQPFLQGLATWLREQDWHGRVPVVLMPGARAARELRGLGVGKALVFSAFDMADAVRFLGGEPLVMGADWAVRREIVKVLKDLDPEMGAARLLARANHAGKLLERLDVYGVDSGRLAGLARELASDEREPLAVLARIYAQVEAVMRQGNIVGAGAVLRGNLELFGQLVRAGGNRFVPVVARLPEGPPVLREFLLRLVEEMEGWDIGNEERGNERAGEHFSLRGTDNSVPSMDNGPCGERGKVQKDEATSARPTALEIVAEGPWQEVRLTALAVRRALAAGPMRVAVVSGERGFNAKLQHELARWDLRAQDSAGTPLADTAAGRVWVRMLEVLAAPDAVRWAALVRESLFSLRGADNSVPSPDSGPCEGEVKGDGGVPTFDEDALRLRQRVWREALRGLPRRADGGEWRAALEGAVRQGCEVRGTRREETGEETFSLRGFDNSVPSPDRGPCEEMGESKEVGDTGVSAWRLWEGGDAVAAAVREILDAVEERVDAALVCALLLRGLRERVVLRPGSEGLFLLGPQEARLLRFDCLIIPRMVEGVWPALNHSAWLAPGHLRALGLPDAAAEAVQAGTLLDDLMRGRHGQVIVLRPSHASGAECAPSRFLRGMNLQRDGELVALDGVLRDTAPEDVRGAFVPVGGQYPRSWSASFVETLMACPYRAYGERILKLIPPEPLEPEPDARAGGLLVHAWLEKLGREFSEVTPANRAAVEVRLLGLADELLAEEEPLVRALWRPRLRKLAPALVARWLEDGRVLLHSEFRVEKMLGEVRVHATIDRVESQQDGAKVVLDFKTGTPPSWSEVARGVKPQLALEGWLLGDVAALEYWRLRGFGAKPLDVTARDAAPLVEPVEDGVAGLLDAFAEGAKFMALPDVSGGGLLDSGHCEYCALADICRKRVSA